MADNTATFLAAVQRVGYLLTTKPNPAELREKEALLKKLVRTISVDSVLLSCEFPFDSINLLILLQIIGRALQVSCTAESASKILDGVGRILASRVTIRATRYQAMRILSILIVKYLKPSSILAFVETIPGLSDDEKLNIFSEMAQVEPMVKSAGTSELLARYGTELLPVLLRSEMVEVLEKWIDYIPSVTLAESPLFPSSISLGDCEKLDDILVRCCSKPELRLNLGDTAMRLLSSNDSHHQLISLRMFSSLFKDSPIPPPVIHRIKTVLSDPSIFHIDFRDSVLCLLEESNILDPLSYELSVMMTVFPANIESRYPCRNRVDYVHRQRVNENDPNDVVRYKFFDLREDTRQWFRKARLEIDEKFVLGMMQSALVTLPNWQLFESVVHSVGALGLRFNSAGNFIPQVCRQLASTVTVNSPRPLVTVTVLAYLSFSKSVDKSILNTIMIPFVVQALATLDTIDYETGWFDFRSKQDNSAVGFLHFISSDSFSGRIDDIAFARQVESGIHQIKDRIFRRDPFRQTRDIFVRSVVSIVMRNSDRPVEILKRLLVTMCEEAADLANFLLAAERIKEELWWDVQRILNRELILARGGEIIVKIFAKKFSVDEVAALIDTGFAMEPRRWVGIVPDVCEIHQTALVQKISPLVLKTPLQQIPPKWFDCVVRSGGKETCREWLHALWNVRDSIPADLIPAVCDFILSVSRNNPESRHVCFNLLVRLTISHPGYNEPIDSMIGVASMIATELLQCAPTAVPIEEYRLFLNGLETRDGRKIRRFLKKFPNVVFSQNS